MKVRKLAISLATILSLVAPPALADLVVPWLSYRTGPYSPSGIPAADGFADYFTLLNERDGGIGGELVKIIECETGYNTQKGVECYEATKGEGSLVYAPLSTGITYQLIPKVAVDQIPMHTMGYGRTSAKNGAIFEWIFNFPGNYWDGASIAINHILDENGGDISGKKIALVYHNSAYGKEPIKTLEKLSEKYGYELTLIPVDHPGLEQKSQWLEIRRGRMDYVLMWGWGVMNSVAIQEAANIRFPMENFIGIWWSGSENDVIPAGERAHNYKALALHGVGTDYPLYDDLKTYVYDKGLAAGDGSSIGSVLYNRAIYNSALLAEAIRTAQEMHGVSDITPVMMRDGLENLSVTEEVMASWGLPGFAPPFEVSCENHGGDGLAMVQQWDAEAMEWNIITGLISSDKEIIDPLIMEDSTQYATENNITPRC
ncbi:MAG: ABC transporter substrate-binding protein [Paracoccaceae bacterium]|nr:ABC transporter substrate-binding protein [Paracoccaceae bacterium]MDE2759897.1 ABC transporter substrate-binding protein [Paracoccaceae bacterium]MDE2915737.1 ABC transporter substrate-binding protein [Paracoccaceae bacterium]